MVSIFFKSKPKEPLTIFHHAKRFRTNSKRNFEKKKNEITQIISKTFSYEFVRKGTKSLRES